MELLQSCTKPSMLLCTNAHYKEEMVSWSSYHYDKSPYLEDCGLSMWGKIIIPMYRLRLNGLYGLYGPRCPLSSERPINLISLSLSHIWKMIFILKQGPEYHRKRWNVDQMWNSRLVIWENIFMSWIHHDMEILFVTISVFEMPTWDDLLPWSPCHTSRFALDGIIMLPFISILLSLVVFLGTRASLWCLHPASISCYHSSSSN